uniref:Telethonin n=1 Tax=Sus scrofa TaxID=9823 RepID=A0A8D0SLP7_PIG
MATSELSCQVSEENCERREAFWAEWKDLTLSTRPEEGCSLHEEDAERRETYHQQGQCQALVQRSPWLVMRMGILGRGLQEYQLPYQRVLPLPIFTPAKVGAAKEEREETPIQLRELLALETALGGQCLDRQDRPGCLGLLSFQGEGSKDSGHSGWRAGGQPSQAPPALGGRTKGTGEGKRPLRRVGPEQISASENNEKKVREDLECAGKEAWRRPEGGGREEGRGQMEPPAPSVSAAINAQSP